MCWEIRRGHVKSWCAVTLTAILTTSSRRLALRLDLLRRVSSSLHESVTRLSLSLLPYPCCWLAAHADAAGASARSVVAVKAEGTTFQTSSGPHTRHALGSHLHASATFSRTVAPSLRGMKRLSGARRINMKESETDVVTVEIERFSLQVGCAEGHRRPQGLGFDRDCVRLSEFISQRILEDSRCTFAAQGCLLRRPLL